MGYSKSKANRHRTQPHLKKLEADRINHQRTTVQRTRLTNMDAERNRQRAETKRRNKKRYQFKLGTWNIRTLLQVGKMDEINEQRKIYNIDILALQEVRWKDRGIIERKEYSLFYSGEVKQGRNGTAFMVNKRLVTKVRDVQAVNGRISYIRISNQQAAVTIINAYAPTEDAEEENKLEFYEKLEETFDKIPRRDTVILVGDFNAMIGKESFVETVAGKHTIHDNSNDNGTKLCNLAAAMNMLIMSTKFEHKREHKVTWLQPGRTTGNQIDHILIARKWGKLVHDVRSYRGANADTDHILTIATMKMGIIKDTNIGGRAIKRWNVERLNNPEMEMSYSKEMERHLEGDTGTCMEDEWANIKLSIVTATENTIGTRRMVKNEWFDEECVDNSKTKREARIKWIKTEGEREKIDYNEIRKYTTKLYKKKKNEWINNHMNEIESSNKDNTKLFNAIRRLNTKRKPTIGNIEINKWEDHFNKLYREKRQVTECSMVENIQEGIEEQQPTLDECIEVIKRLKSKKAPGIDTINNELIKYGGNTLAERIHRLILKIWKEEHMPSEWRTGLLVPVPKKGDPTDCTNYRGIMLLNTSYKILTSIIHKRLEIHLDREVGDYQQGFRKGRSTIDAIHIITQIIEKCHEHEIIFHILFVDFKQAFDSLIRQALAQEMKNLNIPEKIIRLVKMTMEGSKAVLTTSEGTTGTIRVETGVRQGDALSADLFNIALEGVIRALKCTGTIATKSVQVIAYADDIVIIARNIKSLNETFLTLDREANSRGLAVNVNKTKYMTNSTVKTNPITINMYKFEKVESFKYLGVMVNTNNDRNEEIAERVQAGNRAYFCHRRTLHNNNLSKYTKIRIYKTIIRPIITYAGETMCLTRKTCEKLRIVERKIVRRIMGPRRTGENEYTRLTNSEIKKILNEDIVCFIKSQRIRWYGHVKRRNSEAYIHSITKWKPVESRPRGRPKSRWEDQVMEDLKNMGIKNWREDVGNRKAWRAIATEAKTSERL